MLKKNKTKFSINDDISYEYLERNAICVVTFLEGTEKEEINNNRKTHLIFKYLMKNT